MIWIVGEYAERIDNADELLEGFLDGFKDETNQVQLQLLTAIVKLFLKKPTETPQELVTKVLRGFLDKIKPGLSRTVVFMVKSKVKPNVTDAAQQTMLRKVKVCAQGASQAPHSPKSFAGGGRRPMPARRGRREMELHETALGEIFNEVFA